MCEQINEQTYTGVVNPLVSVVITTFYRNEQLKEAIESVSRQTYEPIEIIIVDGSGEKHAAQVAKKFNVEYIATEENYGPNHDRSLGIDAANGEYIAFLDDDDKYKDSKIKEQVDKITDDTSVGVVYCGIEFNNGDIITPRKSGDVLKDALMFDIPGAIPSTLLIKANIAKKISPLPKYDTAEDLAVLIELADDTNFTYIECPLIRNNRGGNNRGHNIEDLQSRIQIVKDYNKVYSKFDDHIINTAKSRAYRNGANILLKEKYFSLRAIQYSALSLFYTNDNYLNSLLHLCVTISGRTGMKFAQKYKK